MINRTDIIKTIERLKQAKKTPKYKERGLWSDGVDLKIEYYMIKLTISDLDSIPHVPKSKSVEDYTTWAAAELTAKTLRRALDSLHGEILKIQNELYPPHPYGA